MTYVDLPNAFHNSSLLKNLGTNPMNYGENREMSNAFNYTNTNEFSSLRASILGEEEKHERIEFDCSL